MSNLDLNNMLFYIAFSNIEMWHQIFQPSLQLHHRYPKYNHLDLQHIYLFFETKNKVTLATRYLHRLLGIESSLK